MHPRHQSQLGGERDGDVRGGAPEALGCPRHPARERSPRGWRPRVRGRDHALASARRPPGDVTVAFEGRHPDDLAFPRQWARTRSGTLGVARSFTVSPDGARVVFLRTKTGDDPVTCLWILDVASGDEVCRYDPREHGDVSAELTEAERARRERMRERAQGVTTYACDRDVTRV